MSTKANTFPATLYNASGVYTLAEVKQRTAIYTDNYHVMFMATHKRNSMIQLVNMKTLYRTCPVDELRYADGTILRKVS